MNTPGLHTLSGTVGGGLWSVARYEVGIAVHQQQHILVQPERLGVRESTDKLARGDEPHSATSNSGLAADIACKFEQELGRMVAKVDREAMTPASFGGFVTHTRSGWGETRLRRRSIRMHLCTVHWQSGRAEAALHAPVRGSANSQTGRTRVGAAPPGTPAAARCVAGGSRTGCCAGGWRRRRLRSQVGRRTACDSRHRASPDRPALWRCVPRPSVCTRSVAAAPTCQRAAGHCRHLRPSAPAGRSPSRPARRAPPRGGE